MNDHTGQPVEASPRMAQHVAEELALHGRWLRTVLAARGVEAPALDEAVQETMLAAVRSAEGIRDPARFAPWLYQVAVRQALLHRRRAGRARRLVDGFAHSGCAPVEATDADPLAWLLAEEQMQLVRRAIAALPRRDAEILLLKYTEDWSYGQLAQRLGISQRAVEARLHRARERLRRTLARLAPDHVPHLARVRS